jgi:hypothetical protein
VHFQIRNIYIIAFSEKNVVLPAEMSVYLFKFFEHNSLKLLVSYHTDEHLVLRNIYKIRAITSCSLHA